MNLQVDSPLDGCNTTEHPRWNTHTTHYGFDQFGFAALSGGARSSSGGFNIGSIGYWWTSTVNSGTDIWYRVMYSSHGGPLQLSYETRQQRALYSYAAGSKPENTPAGWISAWHCASANISNLQKHVLRKNTFQTMPDIIFPATKRFNYC